jgi:predicted transposase/invertase (TIGR01784 family)
MKLEIVELLKNNGITIPNAQEMLRKIFAKAKVKGEEKKLIDDFTRLLQDKKISPEQIHEELIPFADPTLDVSFKMLFGQDKNKEILISLLNSLLNFTDKARIIDVKINPSELVVSNLSDKKEEMGITSAVDILCTNEGKELIAIEMQGQKKNYFLTREQEYMAKLISGQVKEGQGQQYHEKVLDTYIIVIGKENMFVGNTALSDQNLFEIDVEPRVVQTGEKYPGNKMHWKFFELPKFKASDQYIKIKEYDKLDTNSDEKLLKEKFEWLRDNLKEQWLEFLIECNNKTEVPDRNELIRKGYNIMKLATWSPNDQALYWKQEQNEIDSIMQQKYDKEEAYSKGLKEGLEQGFKKGKLEEKLTSDIDIIKVGIQFNAEPKVLLDKFKCLNKKRFLEKAWSEEQLGKIKKMKSDHTETDKPIGKNVSEFSKIFDIFSYVQDHQSEKSGIICNDLKLLGDLEEIGYSSDTE